MTACFSARTFSVILSSSSLLPAAGFHTCDSGAGGRFAVEDGDALLVVVDEVDEVDELDVAATEVEGVVDVCFEPGVDGAADSRLDPCPQAPRAPSDVSSVTVVMVRIVPLCPMNAA